MEVKRVLRMGEGTGDTSYASNSSLQKTGSVLLKHLVDETILDLCNSEGFIDGTISIADLGCSSGPNTLWIVSEIINIIDRQRRLLGRKSSPQYLIYLNDLESNDFNTVFKTFLPPFYEELRREKGEEFGPCFVAAMPGSFYGRLFPNKSLHFVHSSYKSFLEGVDICSFGERSFLATVCMLSVWSPMLIFLLGTQGSFVVLAFVLKVWCITRLQNVTYETTNSNRIGPFVDNSLSVAQLSLLAVCLFFYSGHWCAFDGLRYGAAFIGFDEFNLIRQGILLAIDTFGFSHILPIFSLPILVVFQNPVRLGSQSKTAFYYKLTEVYLIYGLATAVTTTLTIICVTIHRRHLMEPIQEFLPMGSPVEKEIGFANQGTNKF